MTRNLVPFFPGTEVYYKCTTGRVTNGTLDRQAMTVSYTLLYEPPCDGRTFQVTADLDANGNMINGRWENVNDAADAGSFSADRVQP